MYGVLRYVQRLATYSSNWCSISCLLANVEAMEVQDLDDEVEAVKDGIAEGEQFIQDHLVRDADVAKMPPRSGSSHRAVSKQSQADGTGDKDDDHGKDSPMDMDDDAGWFAPDNGPTVRTTTYVSVKIQIKESMEYKVRPQFLVEYFHAVLYATDDIDCTGARFLPFGHMGAGDHRCFMINIPYQALIGQAQQHVVRPSAHHLMVQDAIGWDNFTRGHFTLALVD